MSIAIISNYKTAKFDRDTKEKRFAKEAENFWKHNATFKRNEIEREFARSNQTQ